VWLGGKEGGAGKFWKSTIETESNCLPDCLTAKIFQPHPSPKKQPSNSLQRGLAILLPTLLRQDPIFGQIDRIMSTEIAAQFNFQPALDKVRSLEMELDENSQEIESLEELLKIRREKLSTLKKTG
jgi:hypothetical protein